MSLSSGCGPILIHIEGHIDNIHQDHAWPVGTAERTPSTIFSSNCLAAEGLDSCLQRFHIYTSQTAIV